MSDRMKERRELRERLVKDRIGIEIEVRRQGTENQSAEFDHSANVIMSNCKECSWRIAIHCDDCKVPITGCNCTLTERIENSARKIAARQAGLWLPEQGR